MKLERKATISELDYPGNSLLSLKETLAGFVVENSVGEKLLCVQGVLPRPLFPLSG